MLWVGFIDFYFGIDYFEWCLGKSLGFCNYVDYENILLLNRVIKIGMLFFLLIDFYFILKLINRVGLLVECLFVKF